MLRCACYLCDSIRASCCAPTCFHPTLDPDLRARHRTAAASFSSFLLFFSQPDTHMTSRTRTSRSHSRVPVALARLGRRRSVLPVGSTMSCRNRVHDVIQPARTPGRVGHTTTGTARTLAGRNNYDLAFVCADGSFPFRDGRRLCRCVCTRNTVRKYAHIVIVDQRTYLRSSAAIAIANNVINRSYRTEVERNSIIRNLEQNVAAVPSEPYSY
ncbi:hypothetical protein DFH09DRAFT_247529 [Mycena vulgaris]|nr:hypothetical protein DFH09DRAFT_247529 [Mycena vulgaris]